MSSYYVVDYHECCAHALILDWECVQKPDELVYYKVEVAGLSVTPNGSFSLHIESSISW